MQKVAKRIRNIATERKELSDIVEEAEALLKNDI